MCLHVPVRRIVGYNWSIIWTFSTALHYDFVVESICLYIYAYMWVELYIHLRTRTHMSVSGLMFYTDI